MPKPVCIPCKCFYRPRQNGIAWIEGMPDGKGDPEANIRGKRAPERWSPYKLWISDMWECPDCGHQIIVGHAHAPISEHYMPGFAEEAAARGVDLQVNDC